MPQTAFKPRFDKNQNPTTVKNKQLIEKALEALSSRFGCAETNVDKAKKLITEFLVSQTATSVGKFDLSKFVSRDKADAALRRALTGVYHDPAGYKVATDAHILCALVADVSGLENQVITPKGERVTERDFLYNPDGTAVLDKHGAPVRGDKDVTYPNWRAVCPTIPNESFREVDYPLDLEQLAEAYKTAKVEAKAKGLTIVFDYAPIARCSLYLDGGLLMQFASFLKAFPTAKLYASDDTRPIYALDDAGNRCLLMALRKDWSNDRRHIVTI